MFAGTTWSEIVRFHAAAYTPPVMIILYHRNVFYWTKVSVNTTPSHVTGGATSPHRTQPVFSGTVAKIGGISGFVMALGTTMDF